MGILDEPDFNERLHNVILLNRSYSNGGLNKDDICEYLFTIHGYPYESLLDLSRIDLVSLLKTEMSKQTPSIRKVLKKHISPSKSLQLSQSPLPKPKSPPPKPKSPPRQATAPVYRSPPKQSMSIPRLRHTPTTATTAMTATTATPMKASMSRVQIARADDLAHTARTCRKECCSINDKMTAHINSKYNLNIEYFYGEQGGGGHCFFYVIGYILSNLQLMTLKDCSETNAILRQSGIKLHSNELINCTRYICYLGTMEISEEVLYSLYGNPVDPREKVIDMKNTDELNKQRLLVHYLSNAHEGNNLDFATISNTYNIFFIIFDIRNKYIYAIRPSGSTDITSAQYYGLIDYPSGHYRSACLKIDDKLYSYGETSQLDESVLAVFRKILGK